VRHFRQIWPDLDLHQCRVACIGPSTADTSRTLGLPVATVAEEHTAEGLVDALIALFSR
jgi:uroporphyrinogen-III synthase